MLKTNVILSRGTNLSDARYAAGMGVNYIGFSINPENAEYVTVDQVKTISDWLSGVSFIGDVGDSLMSNVEEYGSTYIQISNALLIDDLDEPILSLDLTTDNKSEVINTLQTYSASVLFFIVNVDAEAFSSLQPQLKELCNNYQIYISTEFDSQKLALVLSEIKPTGIVLYGSNEEKPGFSNYDGIAEILEQLDEEG